MPGGRLSRTARPAGASITATPRPCKWSTARLTAPAASTRTTVTAPTPVTCTETSAEECTTQKGVYTATARPVTEYSSPSELAIPDNDRRERATRSTFLELPRARRHGTSGQSHVVFSAVSRSPVRRCLAGALESDLQFVGQHQRDGGRGERKTTCAVSMPVRSTACSSSRLTQETAHCRW